MLYKILQIADREEEKGMREERKQRLNSKVNTESVLCSALDTNGVILKLFRKKRV